MPIRVAHVGTGNVGRLALRQLIDDPRFELVAVGVHSPGKVGRDAGDLAGLGVTTGISAVTGIDAVLRAQPECVVYCANFQRVISTSKRPKCQWQDKHNGQSLGDAG